MNEIVSNDIEPYTDKGGSFHSIPEVLGVEYPVSYGQKPFDEVKSIH